MATKSSTSKSTSKRTQNTRSKARASNKSTTSKPAKGNRKTNSKANKSITPATQKMQSEVLGIILMALAAFIIAMAAAPQQSIFAQSGSSVGDAIGVGRWIFPWPLLVIGGLLFLKRLPERWPQRLFGYVVLALGIWLVIAFLLPQWAGTWGMALRQAFNPLAFLGVLAAIFIISLGVDMLVDIAPTLTAKRGWQRLRMGTGRGFRGLWHWRNQWKRRANYGADKALVQQQLRTLDRDVKTLGLVHNSVEEKEHLQNWHNTIAQLRDRLHLTKAHHSDAEEMLENGIATARDWRDAVDGFTQESAQILSERMAEEGIKDFDNGMTQMWHQVGQDVGQLHPVGLSLEKQRKKLARELDDVKKQYHSLLSERDGNVSHLRTPNATILAKNYASYQKRLEKYEALTERCGIIAERGDKLQAWRAYSADLNALESRHAGEPFDALVKDQAKLLSQGLGKLSAQQARAEVDALLEQLNIPVPATARPFAQADNYQPASATQPNRRYDSQNVPQVSIQHKHPQATQPPLQTMSETQQAVSSLEANFQAEHDSALDNSQLDHAQLDKAQLDNMQAHAYDDTGMLDTNIEGLQDFEGVQQGELEQAIINAMVQDSHIDTDTLPKQEGELRFKPKLSVASSLPKPSKPSFPSTDWQRPAEPVRFNDLNPDESIDTVPDSYVASFQRPSAVTQQASSTPSNSANHAAVQPADAYVEQALGYEERFPSQTPAMQQPLDFDSERLTQQWQQEALSEKGEETISFATAPVVNAELDLPSIGILQPKRLPSPDMSVDDRHVLERTSIINRTIQSFKLNGQVKKSVRGPTVSRFEIEPAEGEKISRYANLSDDIALAMGVESVRVEAPIQGKKNIIGLEVPNEKRDLVSFREAIEDEAFAGASGKKLPVVLGRSIDGEMRIEDLGKMPHLLIAGSTGSGKSVAVNVLISSLLYRYTPEKLRFLMIDPKMVELTPYDAVPHLLRPVVTNPNDAAGVLLGAVAHMERRYKMMSKIGAKSLEQYNAKAKELEMPEMPYIVIIIDELADLMITSPKEVESAIMRLAQMARATGMHLILATQRPSVDILTSLIKVNIPARIAFAVSSSHDSRTILDAMGAERLTGQGDMLFYKPGLVKSIRLQGPFVSESEVAAIAEHWGSQTPFFEDEFVEAYGGDFDPTPDSDSDVSLVDWNDDKLRDAAELVVAEGQASVSRLQRRLQVGHARAGKLMDSLEALAIVGPHQGSKPREVLVVMADLPNILGRG